MSNLNRNLKTVIENTHKRLYENYQIMPVKTAQGILVGTVLIVANESVKDIHNKGELVYKDVSLNQVVIRLANILTKDGKTTKADAIYRADQEYGKFLTESQLLRKQYQKARESNDHDRADVLLARYCTARDKVLAAKKQVLSLVSF